MNQLIYLILNKVNLLFTFFVLSNLTININCYVIGNKLTKSAGNGQSNIAYSQDNKGSYNFAYEVTDKGGATNFRQETGGPKAVKGSYGLTDVDGRTRLVNYKADKYGFVATVDTNEPGTGREDAANAAYNGPDKGHGWAYAVQVQDAGIAAKTNKNKYDGQSYQSYSYSSNFNGDTDKYNNQNSQNNQNNNEEQYNEKNYDRRVIEEYKNPTQLPKPILNQKQQEQQTKDNEATKKDDRDLISNVNYESGGHFDPSLQTTNPENVDKSYDQSKQSTSDDGSENLDGSEESIGYDKREMRHPSRSDYLTTIEKIAKKEKINSKSSSSKSNQQTNKKKSTTSNKSKSEKIISKLISLSSSSNLVNSFDDGSWQNDKYDVK